MVQRSSRAASRWLSTAVVLLVSRAAVCSESYGPWEVRRARTVDAARAGGYPTWDVRFSGPYDCPAVEIGGDRGPARGTMYVGRRVRIPSGRQVALSFSYKTFCQLAHRSGALQVLAFTPERWDSLGTGPETEVGVTGGDDLSPVWRWSVHALGAADVVEFAPVPPDAQRAMGRALGAFAGEELVVAIAWTGAHSNEEWAAFRALHLLEREREDPLQALLGRLDLQRPELAGVRQAAEAGDAAVATDRLIQHFRARFPPPTAPRKLTKGTFEDADEALGARFRSCGSDEYFELGKDFTWSKNAIDDKEWLLHFHWHAILVTLVEAGAIRDDARYAGKAIELIRDWTAMSYPGAQWAWRTLEVSLRSMAWTRVYRFLLHDPRFARDDHAVFLTTLAEHGDFLLPASRFHSGHNFGTTESKALVALGVTYPEFAAAETWRSTGWQRFEGEINAQVLDDGAQVELTTGYHNSVLTSFLTAGQLIEPSGVKPSAAYWERLERMHEYTMFLTKPDGTQPCLGDSGRGDQFRVLARGAAVFGRDDMLFVASRGTKGSRPQVLDTQLPSAGYYVMRTSWTDDPAGIYLLLDAAHHWGGGHQHRDALGINLYAFGRTLTPDAGPFSYDHPLRALFRSTPAHSTVSIDGEDQNTSACVLHSRHADDAFSFLDASQEGYTGVRHRRQVLFARPVKARAPYFVIVDRVTGTGERTADLHFHLFPAERVVDQARCVVRTAANEGANLLVRGISTAGVTLECLDSWVSLRYAEKTVRPHVRFRHRGIPALFVTLLVPYGSQAPPDIECTLLGGVGPDSDVVVEVVCPEGRDVVFARTEPGAGRVAGVETAGRAGLIRRDRDGRLLHRTVVRGSAAVP